MAENSVTADKKTKIVIRFSGDSGDGIQLTGDLFSSSSAIAGNDLTTVPDFPAEIRAPQGSISGVSSFQVQFGGTKVYTPGDQVDVLVVMNPAALKANLNQLKQGGTIIADEDNFNKNFLKKANYETNPLEDGSLSDYKVVPSPISTLTKESLKELGLEMKAMLRSKNMFALGIVYYMFNRPLENTFKVIEQKFSARPKVIEANKLALQAGYNYADNTEILGPSVIIPPAQLEKGTYRNIDGNTAASWGLLAASEKTGKKLSLCSYPITPASEILHEISARKDLGAIAYQAEDEIAAVCAAIGASYSGNLAATSTSGPGASLKSEAMGLAVIAELPLVMINVQRAGPSTGLPTKSEQSDLFQSLYGRHGEAPLIVMAASSPDDCFIYSYLACKYAIEHMTPVILLSDSYLASGSHPWRVPNLNDLPDIALPVFDGKPDEWKPYMRAAEKLNRYWMSPGTPGFEHRIGGLEKEIETGNLSYDGDNHEQMIQIREDKVARVADQLPEQEVVGAQSGKLLVTGWGSSYGALNTAVEELIDEGVEEVGFTHFNYIHPLPRNTEEVFSRFDNVMVCELNNGQFAGYLRSQLPNIRYEQYNKIQTKPFYVGEIKKKIMNFLER